MQLGRLLENRALRLELVVDPGGARELAVCGVSVAEGPMPERLAGGGGVLLMRRGQVDDPAATERLLDAAHDGGVVAVGVGVDRAGGCLPGSVVASCRARGLALVSLPADVSFDDVAAEFRVHRADLADGMRAALNQSRQLLSSVAAGRELDDLASVVVGATGVGCTIVTATGRRICAHGRELSDDDVDELLRGTRAAADFAATTAGRTVLPIGRCDDAARAWHLVVDGRVDTLPADAADAFAEFASVAALVHAREAESLALRDRHDDLAVAERLAAPEGSSCSEGGAVLVVRSGDPDRARPLVRDALTADVADATVAVHGGDVVAHLPTGSPDATVAAVGQRLRQVVDLLGAPSIGYCAMSDGASFDGAVRGARQAARFRESAESCPLPITAADSLGTAASLFAHLPDDVRTDFVRRVLGPLQEHDAATKAGLLDTLAQFLANDCSWVRTATAMDMHQNTVRYRIGRTEQLIGRNLSDLADRVDVHLALELR
ncbi:PucR family transcriptional regulator [Gordonia iterans]